MFNILFFNYLANSFIQIHIKQTLYILNPVLRHCTIHNMYNYVLTASYILSTRLVGYIYNCHVTRQPRSLILAIAIRL